MSTHCPLPAAPPISESSPRLTRSRPVPVPGSSHYAAPRSPRLVVALSIVLSAAIHTGLLFYHSPPKKKAVTHAKDDTIAVAFTLPDIKELEEVDPKPEEAGDVTEAKDFAPAPMQVDLPRPIELSDFVQELDYSSFIDRTSLNRDQMWVIPEARRGGKIGQHLGNIFNLADVERAPEPVFQPPPVYPGNMRREGTAGKVMVEFIVNTKGEAVNAFVVESTEPGFNAAAIAGVERWKFRPGMRAGRKVNTRIRVPVMFSIIESSE